MHTKPQALSSNISIGIRATPSIVFYAIVEEMEDSYEIKIVDKLVVPVALLAPEQLKFIRNTFLDILSEFKINLACIRVTESAAQNPNAFRIGLEAVILELFASSSIERYYAGQISNISSKLDINRDMFKLYVDNTKAYEEIDTWGEFKPESREALLAAFSAFKLI